MIIAIRKKERFFCIYLLLVPEYKNRLAHLNFGQISLNQRIGKDFFTGKAFLFNSRLSEITLAVRERDFKAGIKVPNPHLYRGLGSKQSGLETFKICRPQAGVFIFSIFKQDSAKT